MRNLREEVVRLSNEKPLDEGIIQVLGNIAAGGLTLCSLPIAYAVARQFIEKLQERKVIWGRKKLANQVTVDNYAKSHPENRDGLVSFFQMEENSPKATIDFYTTSDFVTYEDGKVDFADYAEHYSRAINSRAKDLRGSFSINKDVKKVASALKEIEVTAAFFFDINKKQASVLKNIITSAMKKYFGDYTVKVKLIYNYKTWENSKYGQSLE